MHESTQLAIRPAEAADAETIVEFNRRLAAETESKELDLAALREGVRGVLGECSRGRYWLACHDDEVVGQLMVTTEWSDWRNGSIWWIQSVYVRPDCRRLGVFRQLYEHVRQLAAADPGVVGLRLYVERDNLTAQRAYRSARMADAGYLVFEEMFRKG